MKLRAHVTAGSPALGSRRHAIAICEPERGLFGVVDVIDAHGPSALATRIVELVRSDDDLRAAREAVHAHHVAHPPEWSEPKSALVLRLDPDARRARVAHVGANRVYRLRAGAIDRVVDAHMLRDTLQRQGRTAGNAWPVILRDLSADAPTEIVELELTAGDRLLLVTDAADETLDDSQRIARMNAGSPPPACVVIAVEAD